MSAIWFKSFFVNLRNNFFPALFLLEEEGWCESEESGSRACNLENAKDSASILSRLAIFSSVFSVLSVRKPEIRFKRFSS